jgi:hypothetical protein
MSKDPIPSAEAVIAKLRRDLAMAQREGRILRKRLEKPASQKAPAATPPVNPKPTRTFAMISRLSPHELLLDRLTHGKDKPCLFLPFVGEFGHEIMSHIRLVHFHHAKEKVVCCRPGHEVLYPSATSFVTDWEDPIPDFRKVGTLRNRVLRWPELRVRYPDHYAVKAGMLAPEQEVMIIEPGQRIPFQPKKRGLTADVVLGVRNRAFCPERNWKHWQQLADAITAAGLTFAVIGRKDTSCELTGQTHHSGDYDTDAAIELLQNCKLYVGTDSGTSHLAAEVGAKMLLFRETAGRSRDLTVRMAEVNPDRVEQMDGAGGWEDPVAVGFRTLMAAGHLKITTSEA